MKPCTFHIQTVHHHVEWSPSGAAAYHKDFILSIQDKTQFGCDTNTGLRISANLSTGWPCWPYRVRNNNYATGCPGNQEGFKIALGNMSVASIGTGRENAPPPASQTF